METVVLKNDAEELKSLVIATMMSLEFLMKEQPIVFYELVMKCRDHNHRFFGNTGEDLEKLALVQPGGSVHDSICNIVLSATNGNGLKMTLGSPIK